MSAHILPQGFESLIPFLDRWAHDTTEARLNARASMAMSEIRAFYDAMLDHASAAIDLIDRYPLDNLPADVANLAKLILGLGQASIAVEVHGAPRAPGTPWPNSIKLVQGAFPYG